jgi:hypothetical protein
MAARGARAAGSEGGAFGLSRPASNPDLHQALLGGLRDLGYVEGQNLAIDYRFMLGQAKRYDELAAELAGLAPDATVVVGTPKRASASRSSGAWMMTISTSSPAAKLSGRVQRGRVLSKAVDVEYWTSGIMKWATRHDGYAATREEGMAAFVKSWRRE